MKATTSFTVTGLLGSFLSNIYSLDRVAWLLALLTALDGLATSFMLKYGDANMKNGWASLGLFTVALSSAALVCSEPGGSHLEYFYPLGLFDYTC